MCDQLGKPDGVEQTGGNACRETLSRQGYDRQASPQRIAGGRMSVVVERVEEEICQPVTGEMLGHGNAFSEDDAVGINAALLGLFAQIAHGPWIGAFQP